MYWVAGFELHIRLRCQDLVQLGIDLAGRQTLFVFQPYRRGQHFRLQMRNRIKRAGKAPRLDTYAHGRRAGQRRKSIAPHRLRPQAM